jgi:hypothetical protein
LPADEHDHRFPRWAQIIGTSGEFHCLSDYRCLITTAFQKVYWWKASGILIFNKHSAMDPKQNSVSSKVAPFLKWAGGKRWLSRDIAELLRNPTGNYIEPFLGGGSVFFQMECRATLLCDINKELINAFRVVNAAT